MAFKIGRTHPKGFSDAEIDAFIAYLRENNLTLETEEQVQAALRSQSNVDPRQFRIKEAERRLEFSKDSSVFSLWTFWDNKPEDYTFRPLEYMRAALEEFRLIAEKNHKAQLFADGEENNLSAEPPERPNPELGDTEGMSRSEIEILVFNKDIDKLAEQLCSQIVREKQAEAAKIEQDIHEHNIEFADSVSDDETDLSNLRNLGGFKNLEDFEKEMHEFAELERMIDDLSAGISDEGAAVEQTTMAPVEILPVDASVMLRLSGNAVRAWLFLLPPRNGGSEVTEQMINEELEKQGVCFGVDVHMIRKIVKNRLYFRLFEIAKGVDPVDGIHGKIVYIAPRTSDIDIREDENGNVDYRELNIIKSVRKDDVIAEIIPPQQGTDGKSVTNLVVKGKEGRYPKIPMGKNTILNEDRSKLMSMIDGEVTYINGKYQVQRLLTITGNVDNSVGNIRFPGDLLVMGDVLEGFTVEVEGNLHIRGTVEAAKIICGGNITLDRGVVGAGRARITAGGYLKCIFLENCTAYAKTHIYAEQITGSEVSCDNSIHVIANKGNIMGGSIVAGRCIEVKVIGNRNNQSLTTEVTLGCTPQMFEQKQALYAKIEEVDKDITKLGQNISYIESAANPQPDRITLLEQLRAQLQLKKAQRSKLTAIVAKVNSQIFNNCKRSRFIADQILSPMTITIGTSKVQIKEETGSCSASLVKGEVVLEKYY